MKTGVYYFLIITSLLSLAVFMYYFFATDGGLKHAYIFLLYGNISALFVAIIRRQKEKTKQQ